MVIGCLLDSKVVLLPVILSLAKRLSAVRYTGEKKITIKIRGISVCSRKLQVINEEVYFVLTRASFSE